MIQVNGQIISTSLRDLLVEKSPIKITNIDFPKDEFSRNIFSSFYIQKLSNDKQGKRKWLIYSQDLDKVFCLCCKLFNLVRSTTKLANEGSRHWRNISHKLRNHEISNEHIANMILWIDLEKRLLKNKTIDKHDQEQINRDWKHWRNVLFRIIAVVKILAKK